MALSGTTAPPGGVFTNGTPPPLTLSALVSQHRFLELSRYGLRGYDLAQHMLSQQGAVSKLLGKFDFRNFILRSPIKKSTNGVLNVLVKVPKNYNVMENSTFRLNSELKNLLDMANIIQIAKRLNIF